MHKCTKFMIADKENGRSAHAECTLQGMWGEAPESKEEKSCACVWQALGGSTNSIPYIHTKRQCCNQPLSFLQLLLRCHERSKIAASKGLPYRHSIEVFGWREHGDEDCTVSRIVKCSSVFSKHKQTAYLFRSVLLEH